MTVCESHDGTRPRLARVAGLCACEAARHYACCYPCSSAPDDLLEQLQVLVNGVTSLQQVVVQWAGLCRVCHEIQHELGVNIIVTKDSLTSSEV